MTETSKFDLHLPGLLKVLAENLYSVPTVALRELIQNAHDSCTRLRMESNAPQDFEPRIEIRTSDNTIEITDNGAGLTYDEFKTYLSTIGRSFTREFGEDLSILSPYSAIELIGQFGFGFLSAFMIADEVTVESKSIKPDSEPQQWHSIGNEHYSLAPGDQKHTGTTVTLTIKPVLRYLLEDKNLLSIVRTYADFLPTPIFINGGSRPVNSGTPPWHAAEPEKAVLEYITETFGESAPIAIIQLTDHEINLGHDTMIIPLEGFLFIPSSTIASVREFGDLHIYIRRMFIRHREENLLPSWARFVRGVIDCPYLEPTASREDIRQNETFSQVQLAIGQQLAQTIRRIAEEQPDVWKRIVRGHADLITSWAVMDDDMFDRIADIVLVRTTRGLMNLPDYLKLTDGCIYCITRELGSLQEQMLGEGFNVPVIDASWFAVEPFLHKYADRKLQQPIIKMDDNAAELFKPLPSEKQEQYSFIAEHYKNRNIDARIVSFQPDRVPAILVYPPDAEVFFEARKALDQNDLQGPMRSLIEEFIENSDDADYETGTLYINSTSPLVNRLVTESHPKAAVNTLLDILYQVARLFSGRLLTPIDATSTFDDLSKSLSAFLEKRQ